MINLNKSIWINNLFASLDNRWLQTIETIAPRRSRHERDFVWLQTVAGCRFTNPVVDLSSERLTLAILITWGISQVNRVCLENVDCLWGTWQIHFLILHLDKRIWRDAEAVFLTFMSNSLKTPFRTSWNTPLDSFLRIEESWLLLENSLKSKALHWILENFHVLEVAIWRPNLLFDPSEVRICWLSNPCFIRC